MMLVNGIPQQHVSLHERALAYGDGVFETVRLYAGNAILLEEHLQRLQEACIVLGINCDFTKLQQEIESLQGVFTTYGVLKIIISRGQGGRGYRPDKALQATRIISLHPLPDYKGFDGVNGVTVFICQQRLSRQKTLAGIKHLNRLEQVLAANEWPEDKVFEGLMRDETGAVIEGTRTNLFFSEAGKLYTPDLTTCGVNGILRQVLLRKSPGSIAASGPSLERLLQADELFLCNSVIGVWPVHEVLIGDKSQFFSAGPFSRIAGDIFREALGYNTAR